MELNSHADKCFVCDQRSVIYDENRPVNVFGYNPKAGSKHAFIVDANGTYDKPETGQLFILIINQAVEMKGCDHNLFVPCNAAWILRKKSSPVFGRQEQSMLGYRKQFFIPTIPARKQLFMNSVILYAYVAANVMDNNNFATARQFYYYIVIWVAQVNTKKVPVLENLVLMKKWRISTEKSLNMINVPLSIGSAQCCIHFYHDSSG